MREAGRLRALGYSLEATADGYRVEREGAFLGGAGVLLPRARLPHWRHRIADLRMFLDSAVRVALEDEGKGRT